ncbi:hypothetical protein [Bosea sp. MMO-172]|uniref:hypothetical protein n=1 Tax=Bosea sp. MMO-172 TaxID=3127885 RepID=UPI00301AB562
MAMLLTKAKAGECRWFVCDTVTGSRDLFGGRRVCGAATAWPSSYCMAHRLRVYQRTEGVAQPPREFAVLRRRPEAETLPELTEMFG